MIEKETILRLLAKWSWSRAKGAMGAWVALSMAGRSGHPRHQHFYRYQNYYFYLVVSNIYIYLFLIHFDWFYWKYILEKPWLWMNLLQQKMQKERFEPLKRTNLLILRQKKKKKS